MKNWPTGLFIIGQFETLLVLTCVYLGFANVPEIQSPMRFEALSSEDGLSQNTINCIFQDSRGFLWFGTQDGLNKFDGYSFEVYKTVASDSTSISHNWIWDIFEDKTGNLWIATWWGLNKYDPATNQFSRFLPTERDPTSINNNRPTAIKEDKNGNLWIGTWGGGLNFYHRENKIFNHFRYQKKDKNSLTNNFIRTLFLDSSNKLWIGTWDGLCTTNLDSVNQEVLFVSYLPDPDNPFSIDGTKITSITEDFEGNIWIGTLQDGLSCFNPATRRFKNFRNQAENSVSISSNNITSVFVNSMGDLWITTQDFGLNQYLRGSEAFLSYKHEVGNQTSLISNNLNTLYEDRSGILWIGTSTSGLNRLNVNSKKFIHFNHSKSNENSLSSNLIRCFYEDQEGNIWVGTGENGLNKYNPNTGIFRHYKTKPSIPHSISHDNVQTITGNNNIIWIGTFGGGLNQINVKTGSIKHYYHDPQNNQSISSNYIETLYLDQDNQLWIGTSDKGLDKFLIDSGKFEHFQFDPKDPYSISTNYILSLFQDSQGTVWIGGWGGGLSRYDEKNNRFTRYLNDPKDPTSLSDNIVNAICETQRNGQSFLWVGTAGGLSYMSLNESSGRKFQHIYEKDGLPNQNIYGIVEDRNGSLWLSTNRGISKFTPPDKIKNYDTGDGLPSNEYSGGAHFRDKQGNIYFGCPRGYIVFDPDSIFDNQYVPPVLITSFKKFNKNYQPNQHITVAKNLKLSYKDYVFSFNFSALDYTAPLKNQYAYKMEGFNENWIFTDAKSRTATFTNMNPGKYVFRVKGSNSDGIWNEAGTSLTIFITPPFWQTWWFRGLVTLFVIYLLFLAHFFRVKHLQQSKDRQIEFSNKLIESQEEERKRIAAELHDSLGQNLLIANNEIQQLQKNRTNKSERFDGLSSIIKESIEEVREISHNLHPHLLDRLGLKKAIESMIKKMSHASEIDFAMQIETIDDLLPKTSQIHFYRIIQEAMNNILKHSQASNASIIIKEIGNQIQTIITDNGKGFQAGLTSHEGLGIKDMKERARLISGDFHLTSKPGTGTKILLYIASSKGV